MDFLYLRRGTALLDSITDNTHHSIFYPKFTIDTMQLHIQPTPKREGNHQNYYCFYIHLRVTEKSAGFVTTPSRRFGRLTVLALFHGCSLYASSRFGWFQIERLMCGIVRKIKDCRWSAADGTTRTSHINLQGFRLHCLERKLQVFHSHILMVYYWNAKWFACTHGKCEPRFFILVKFVV
jgi:hypothetical protein